MKKLTPHPQAEILRAIADGKTVQIRHEDDDAWWEPTNALQYINSDKHKFRIKPKTISINGHEFPKPARERLKDGQAYWIPRTDLLDQGDFQTWTGHYLDERNLKRGLIQLTKEGAIAQAKAMIAAVGGEV